MVSDNFGNVLYNKNDTIFLKLKEREVRKLGLLDCNNRLFHVQRDSFKHYMRKNSSYGFNFNLLNTATKFDTISLTIDKKDVYLIPVQVILARGTYLNFKQQGFELQIFLPLGIIQNYKI